MKIWVDADACPVVLKDILCRAAERTEIVTTFIANQFISLAPSRHTKFIQVGRGFDVADNEIVLRVSPGDLVITSDIPLAGEAIEKGGFALSHRGEMYTANNIRECLNMRDFMDTMRSSGIQTGGPSALSQSDRQAFANELDKFINSKS